ncbi:hypothetical protein LCGC14_0673090 [marine sediment metagenome]|uniref:HD-CE domain-containing protein n=1 Tax=marine sediment metagenome TaxID=412755 RepID=A0A0F9RAQ4_9ZZZZ
MTLTRIFEELHIFKNLNLRYKNKIEGIIPKVQKFFSQTGIAFPEYPPHDLTHVKTVLKNIDILLESIIDDLNQEQLFCLLLGTYLHDIGMAPILEVKYDVKYIGKITEEEKEIIRKYHHIRSYNFILNSPIFDDIDYIHKDAIARIAKGHRKVDLFDHEYIDGTFPVKNLAFLTAALRLADDLDFTYHRVDFLIYFKNRDNYLKKLPLEDIKFFESHLALKSWNLSERNEVLVIRGEIKTIEGHRGIELVKEKIFNILKDVRNIFFNDRQILPLVPEFKLKFVGLSGEDYNFRMDPEAITNYLIKNLYSDYRIAIREGIQNATDACVLRKQIDPSFTPKININFKDNKLIIIDNGRGMNYNIIKNYLTVAGRTFYDSPDYKKLATFLNKDIELIARFGIGIFCFFLLGDMFIFRTHFRAIDKKEKTNWLETRFSKSFCPTFTLEQKPPEFEDNFGTMLEITLSDIVLRRLRKEIHDYLNKTFIRPKISIFFRDHFMKDHKIGLFNLKDQEIIIHLKNNPYVSCQKKIIYNIFFGIFAFNPQSHQHFQYESIFFKKYKDSTKILNTDLDSKIDISAFLPKIIYSEGIYINDNLRFKSTNLKKLINFFTKILRILIKNGLMIITLDIPSKYLTLTLNRKEIGKDFKISTEIQRDVLNSMIDFIIEIKKELKKKKKLKNYYKTYIDNYYNLFQDTLFDIDEAISCCDNEYLANAFIIKKNYDNAFKFYKQYINSTYVSLHEKYGGIDEMFEIEIEEWVEYLSKNTHFNKLYQQRDYQKKINKIFDQFGIKYKPKVSH